MKKIIALFLLAAMLLLVGCKKEEVETQPAIPVVEETQEAPSASEAAEPGKLVSALKCVDSKIQAVVTNTGDAEATLAKDIKILLNGLLVVDPICNEMTLAPGASTFCEDISGHFAIRQGKINTIQLNALRTRTVEYVDCAEE